MTTPDPTIEAIGYATKAYEDTLAECADLELRDRQQAAIIAWRCCLPTLESIEGIRAFIACVAQGQARRWLPPDEAKALNYTAQLALTAWQENHKGRKCHYPKGRLA